MMLKAIKMLTVITLESVDRLEEATLVLPGLQSCGFPKDIEPDNGYNVIRAINTLKNKNHKQKSQTLLSNPHFFGNTQIVCN